MTQGKTATKHAIVLSILIAVIVAIALPPLSAWNRAIARKQTIETFCRVNKRLPDEVSILGNKSQSYAKPEELPGWISEALTNSVEAFEEGVTVDVYKTEQIRPVITIIGYETKERGILFYKVL
jgi:hypothetical protein